MARFAALLLAYLILSMEAVFAVCMSYGDGLKYSCEPIPSDTKAYEWCWERYGGRYQPFKTNPQCSKELAAKLRGDTDPKELIKDIASMADEIDTQI